MTTQVVLKFITESELARFYEDDEGHRFWIPKSVVKVTLKYHDSKDRHQLDIADWWWKKHEETRG